MSKDKLNDYSSTNASNTDVGGVNVDEGMLTALTFCRCLTMTQAIPSSSKRPLR
jgi:hypothetical protein